MNASLPLTLPELLQQSCSAFPDRTALAAVDGDSFSYGDVARIVWQTSLHLRSLGVEPGDRVGLLSENCPQWGMAYFSILALGAVVVPILPDFHPDEIQHIVRHAECSALFVSSRLAPKLEGTTFPHLRATIPIDAVGSSLPRIPGEQLAQVSPIASDSLAAIVYTSGTTGFSKGVMLSHRNIIADAVGASQIVDVGCSDRLLSILPLAHTYECTLGMVLPIMLGASIHYLDKPPTAAILLPAMKSVRPTVILSVPLIIEKIFKARIQPQLERPVIRRLLGMSITRKLLIGVIGRKLLDSFGGELRLFCIGAAPLAIEVEQFLREARFPYAIGYGLTETAPLVTGDPPSSTQLRAVGRPLQGVEVRIASPNSETGEGEILVRGPNVMIGYYKDPERTSTVLTPDGWFHTGDLGVVDSNGYLFIKGRLKNLILGPRGKNIYPEEIESVLNQFDLVIESIVYEHQNRIVAKAHLNYEELKRRFSLHNSSDHQVREHINALLEDIRKQLNQRLAHFSRLHRIIEQSEPFEKTPTQKIKRHLYH